MYCPRCSSPLVKEIIDEVTVEFDVFGCPSCKGLWIVNLSDLAVAEKITEPRLIEFRHIPSSKEQMKPLTCPACDNMQYMNKVESSRDHKVIMDVCPSCQGVWLDKGELRAIQQESWSSIMSRLYKWLNES